QIIEEAKPSVLQLFGFADAVENHLERSVRDSDQALDWRLEDLSGGAIDRLDPKVSIALYRIVQEAVNNAVHHAEAARLVVRLQDTDGVEIVVTDDGRGLGGKRARRGSGIDNMKTRARLISARFTAEAGPGGMGTRVTIRLPAEAGRMAAE
ncbi:MAG: sensor histidine kinase, partial [Paracoccaceae bacterium]|nr:sensor histidine kinase [Paracoccaceae bacterium]